MDKQDLAIFREIVNCRSCGSNSLTSVLDLGLIHLNAFPLPSEKDSAKAPLELVLCSHCSLLQLRHTTNGDLLYRTFFYRSSITQTMKDALHDIVDSCTERARLGRGDLVVDIGSNDSTLLNFYPQNVERIGFEPAENLMSEARASANLTIVNDYFSRKGLAEVTGMRAKIITAIACFYDIDQPNEFLDDVFEALSPDGLFCIQQAYLPDMLRLNDISNICHEHLEYYSLTSLESLLRRHNLRVFDVEQNSINGGSFRTYICHLYSSRYHETEAVRNMRFKEQALGLDTVTPYEKFAQRSQILKGQVRKFISKEAKDGPVYVYGASTKGNTLLQYWGLDRKSLPGAADRDSNKHGRHMVGSRVAIVSEETARLAAKYFLVLPFFFKREFLKREEEWINAGGKMVFALPEMNIVSKENYLDEVG